MRIGIATVGSLVCALAAGACTEHGGDLSGPTSLDELAEVAPTLSTSALVDGLHLDGERASEVAGLIEDLRTAMVALHHASPSGHGDMTDEERTRAHAVLKTRRDEAHTKHAALMAELTEEERQGFYDHLHQHLEDSDGRHGIDHDGGHDPHGTGHDSGDESGHP